MSQQASNFECVPRTARTASLIGLGAVVALVITRPHTSVESVPTTPAYPTYAVGIECEDTNATVSSSRSGNTFEFECKGSDGKPQAVTALLNVVPNHSPSLPEYNQVVDIALAGYGIDFDFKGLDGVAVIHTDVSSQDFTKKQNNTPKIGIARIIHN